VGPIMQQVSPRLQSTDDSIRREARRTGALRNHDGRSSRPTRRHHGRHHRCDGFGRPARRLLPKPALARQARNGHSNHHEEPNGRKRTDPERDGRAEKTTLTGLTAKLAFPSWTFVPFVFKTLQGFTVIIATPCEATAAENFPVALPRSLCCHKSRTDAETELG